MESSVSIYSANVLSTIESDWHFSTALAIWYYCSTSQLAEANKPYFCCHDPYLSCLWRRHKKRTGISRCRPQCTCTSDSIIDDWCEQRFKGNSVQAKWKFFCDCNAGRTLLPSRPLTSMWPNNADHCFSNLCEYFLDLTVHAKYR